MAEWIIYRWVGKQYDKFDREDKVITNVIRGYASGTW